MHAGHGGMLSAAVPTHLVGSVSTAPREQPHADASLPGPGVESAAQLLGRVLVAALEADRLRQSSADAAREQGQADVLRNLHEQGMVGAVQQGNGLDPEVDTTLPEGAGGVRRGAIHHGRRDLGAGTKDGTGVQMEGEDMDGAQGMEAQAQCIVEALHSGREAREQLDLALQRESGLRDAMSVLRHRYI